MRLRRPTREVQSWGPIVGSRVLAYLDDNERILDTARTYIMCGEYEAGIRTLEDAVLGIERGAWMNASRHLLNAGGLTDFLRTYGACAECDENGDIFVSDINMVYLGNKIKSAIRHWRFSQQHAMNLFREANNMLPTLSPQIRLEWIERMREMFIESYGQFQWWFMW